MFNCSMAACVWMLKICTHCSYSIEKRRQDIQCVKLFFFSFFLNYNKFSIFSLFSVCRHHTLTHRHSRRRRCRCHFRCQFCHFSCFFFSSFILCLFPLCAECMSKCSVWVESICEQRREWIRFACNHRLHRLHSDNFSEQFHFRNQDSWRLN